MKTISSLGMILLPISTEFIYSGGFSNRDKQEKNITGKSWIPFFHCSF